MAKKRRKVSRKGRKVARKAPRKIRRKTRKVRRTGRKVGRKRSHARRITRKAKKSVKVTIKVNPPRRRRARKTRKNAWTGHPVLHGRATKIGWGRRCRPTKGYKKCTGRRSYGITGVHFPVQHNPFSRPLGLGRPMARKARRHSYSKKGSTMGSLMNVMSNPLKAVKNIGGGALKPLMDKNTWIDASVIAGGSLASTIGSAYLAAGIAKATGKAIPTTGVAGIALKLAAGAIGATAISYKSPRHAQNFLLGSVAGIMADVIKTQVLPRIPFLNTTATVEDYLQQQGVNDYLEQQPGVGAYVAPSEIATAADESTGSEF